MCQGKAGDPEDRPSFYILSNHTLLPLTVTPQLGLAPWHQLEGLSFPGALLNHSVTILARHPLVRCCWLPPPQLPKASPKASPRPSAKPVSVTAAVHTYKA